MRIDGDIIQNTVFATERLFIRLALPTNNDIKFLLQLWTDPTIMKNVGFPIGLKITHEQVKAKLEDQIKSAPFDCRLIVVEKKSMCSVGEAKLGSPNPNGVAETDVKLLPKHWGKKLGFEIKQGLLEYLFMNTNCSVVRATPNIQNTASIKMQEAVGGIRIEEFIYEFPESMRDYTTPVKGYIYHVTREIWESRRMIK